MRKNKLISMGAVLVLLLTILFPGTIKAEGHQNELQVLPIEGNSDFNVSGKTKEQIIDYASVKGQIPEILPKSSIYFTEKNIEKANVSEVVVASDTENRPPVAALQVAVLNPESLIDGNFTTETQLAWLWSYNGESFTYDPDGDSIANVRIDGISSNDIIGTISGNIGFATQFATPA